MSFAQKFLGRMRAGFGKPAEPQDPHAYVTASLKRGPGGRARPSRSKSPSQSGS